MIEEMIATLRSWGSTHQDIAADYSDTGYGMAKSSHMRAPGRPTP